MRCLREMCTRFHLDMILYALQRSSSGSDDGKQLGAGIGGQKSTAQATAVMRAHSPPSRTWSISDQMGADDQRRKQQVRQKEERTQQRHPVPISPPKVEADGQQQNGEEEQHYSWNLLWAIGSGVQWRLSALVRTAGSRHPPPSQRLDRLARIGHNVTRKIHLGRLMDRCLTAQEAADCLDYNIKHLFCFLNSGKVKGQRVGHIWLIDPKEVERIKGLQGSS